MFFKRLIKKKWLFFLVLIGVIILLIFLGTKIYLLFNFLAGNDIVIKIEADREYGYILNGESKEISFQASVTTNPFCSAVCTSEFLDLATFESLDSSSFELKTGYPFNKKYTIYANDKGKGKKFYRFDMNCKSVADYLCHTDEKTTTRSVLVVAEHDLNDEQKFSKGIIEVNAINSVNLLNDIQDEIENLNDIYYKLNKTIILDFDLDSLNKNFDNNKDDLISFSQNEDYYLMEKEIENISNDIDELNQYVLEIKENVSKIILDYNLLIDDITISRERLIGLNSKLFDENGINKINEVVFEFNNLLNGFSTANYINNKRSEFVLIGSKIDGLGSLSLNEGSYPSINIIEFNISKIEFLNLTTIDIEVNFPEIMKMCTINNEIGQCCEDDICSDDAETYPLVFLHGHAVTKDSSLEYSLEGFDELQKSFEDMYISAGSINIYTERNVPEGAWNLNVPLSIRASYYFDLFEQPDNYVVVLTKSENIDTYAVRLKEVLDTIRYKTGKKKVNIVAFSMGGLVARRHLQLFGDKGINKAILIGAPNNGVIGDVAALCPVVGGEKRECDDLTQGSLFLQKLNSQPTPDIVSNIYGTGCSMVGGIGDGIVLEESARLEGINNYAINGTCRGKFIPLHLDLLDVDRYPEVSEKIKKILANF